MKKYIIQIPPQLDGFKCIGDSHSLISNILSHPYNENEIERADYDSLFPKYEWSTKNK